MHIYSIVVTLGLTLGAAYGNFQPDVQQELPLPEGEAAAKPCCTPTQWEGNVGGVVGYQPHFFSRARSLVEVVRISYDGKNQRIAMSGEVIQSKGVSKFRVIELFKNKKMYVVGDKGKCRSFDLGVAFQPACIPAKAKYGGRFRFGLGKESLVGNSWFMETMGYTWSSSTTATQCIPLSEMAWGAGEGRHKVPMMTSFGYSNITAGIKSAAVFTPPKVCKTGNATEFDIGFGLMRHMHGKFTGL